MDEKLSLLSELIKLAQCDEIVSDQEYEFLLSIAQSLNVSQAEFDQLFNKDFEYSPPKGEFDRILQFHRLVLLMNIDRESSESEITCLKGAGIRLGLSPQATDQVLTMMDAYPNRIIPAEKLIEVFKQQYN